MDTDLRKAAVLIDSLDPVTARILLDRMPPAEAARIHQAQVHLDDISERERRQVLCEFNEENVGGMVGVATDADDDASPALTLLPVESPDELPQVQEIATATSSKPFQFLNDADSAALARHLTKEDSHKVAIVLCHLPPRQAAEVLKQLPDSKRIDVVIRLSNIHKLAPETVCDIESELKELLDGRESGTGFGTILSIMDSVDTWSRNEMIEQLKAQHRELADQISESFDQHDSLLPEASTSGTVGESRQGAPGPGDRDAQAVKNEAEVYEFDDLVQLDGHSLAVLMEESDPEEVLLALTGAAPWMVSRLLGRLPSREEKLLRQKMDRCGPLSLKDIEVAQQKLVQLTAQLAAAGKINPPTRRPFTSLV